MRLGLIGLGRIGTFHTNTLVDIPAIDSLVVTDLVPEKTKSVVERFGGQGVEGAHSLREAGGAQRRGRSRAAPQPRGLDRASADRLPAPIRRGHRGREGGRRE